MSSHHIVRDEQEPALLILNLDAIPSSTLDGLLEWSPTVIITTDLVKQTIEKGFKFDVVVGKHHELEARKSILSNYMPLVFLIAEDEYLLQVVSNYLTESRHSALSILVDTFSKYAASLDSISNLDLVVYDAQHKWHKLAREFKKWFASGQRLKIIGSDYSFLGVEVSSDESKHSFTLQNSGIVKVMISEPVWFGERII